MTYAQVLETVFSSGRIKTKAEADREGFLAEVEAEVQFEASERDEAGELEGTVNGAVEFALSHVG
jgi:hypothetical protein